MVNQFEPQNPWQPNEEWLKGRREATKPDAELQPDIDLTNAYRPRLTPDFDELPYEPTNDEADKPNFIDDGADATLPGPDSNFVSRPDEAEKPLADFGDGRPLLPSNTDNLEIPKGPDAELPPLGPDASPTFPKPGYADAQRDEIRQVVEEEKGEMFAKMEEQLAGIQEDLLIHSQTVERIRKQLEEIEREQWRKE